MDYKSPDRLSCNFNPNDCLWDVTAQSSAISLLGCVSLIEYSNFHASFLLCSPDLFAHVLILIHGQPVCHLILVPLVGATGRWLNKGKVNAP